MEISLNDVMKARRGISKYINKTPLKRCPELDEKSGLEVYLKLENFQKTNAFKLRGALNKVMSLSDEERQRGLVTSSSGNFGLGLAGAAQYFGIDCTVVSPENPIKIKKERAEKFGAKVELYGTYSHERRQKAKEIAECENKVFVHSSNDPIIIAGHATMALEILEDLPDVGTILLPIGGGSLTAGTLKVIKELAPEVKVIGVEPEQSAGMNVSIKAGRLTEFENVNTIADGLRSKHPSELPFKIASEYIDDIVLVSEKEIILAMLFLLNEYKILVEPSGAVSVAAVLFGKINSIRKGKVVSVVTGGNVDLELVAELITHYHKG